MLQNPLGEKGIRGLTDDELVTYMEMRVGQSSELVQLEMTRRLKTALETSATRTEQLNGRVLALTWVIAFFTVVMAVPPVLAFLRWLLA